VSANFRPISNLNNISNILERLFLTRLQPYIASSSSFNHLQSLIANITLLKPLSFTSLMLSTMHAADNGLATLLLSLSLSLSTSVLHSTQLSTPFSSIVSLPVSTSWVPLTTGLTISILTISPTYLFQSLPASSSFLLPSYYGVPKALS